MSISNKNRQRLHDFFRTKINIFQYYFSWTFWCTCLGHLVKKYYWSKPLNNFFTGGLHCVTASWAVTCNPGISFECWYELQLLHCCFWSSCPLTHLGELRVPWLGPLTYKWKTWWDSRPLALVWMTGCCSHLESEPTGGSVLSLSQTHLTK